MVRRTPATLILIGLNAAVYAAMAWQQQDWLLASNVDARTALQWGANFNPFTTGSEPQRLLLSMFLHGGLLHTAVNMLALFTLGTILEPRMGTLRFALLYLLSGFAGGLVSLEVNLFVISVGASGAVFGLYGYRLASDVFSLDDRRGWQPLLINFVVFVALNVGITVLWPGIDWAAHVGGAVAGALLGVLHVKMRWLLHPAALAAVTAAMPLLLIVLPDTQRRYYGIFQQMLAADDRRERALAAAKTDNQLYDSLVVVRADIDSVRRSLASLERVPVPLRNDTAVLGRYAFWRSEELRFRIAMIERESYVYLDSMGVADEKLATLPRLQYVLNYNAPPNPPAEQEEQHPPNPLEPATVYYDSMWRPIATAGDAVYYRVGTRDSLGRWHGWAQDYYRSGVVQMKGYYEKDVKNGIFLYYSERGTYTSAGRYEKEESAGKWETFHWNGTLHRETFYDGDAFTRTVRDSLGNVQVAEGNGLERTWYDNGQVREEGTYGDGRRDGVWRGYHRDGKPYYMEIYQRGILIRGVAVTADGQRYEYDASSLYARPPGGMKAFMRYVDEKKRRPDGPAEAGGVVKVVADVLADGTLSTLVILQSAGKSFDEEAMRILREGPHWRPALLHGHQPVPSQAYVEITFD